MPSDTSMEVVNLTVAASPLHARGPSTDRFVDGRKRRSHRRLSARSCDAATHTLAVISNFHTLQETDLNSLLRVGCACALAIVRKLNNLVPELSV